MKKKVSFDYDSTADTQEVEEFAKELVDRGFEVWIVTTRLDNSKAPSHNWNDDLFNTVMRCGIKFENIHFTNGADKWLFLKDKNFIFHIDDDSHEIDFIYKNIKETTGILYYYNDNWKKECIEALNKN